MHLTEYASALLATPLGEVEVPAVIFWNERTQNAVPTELTLEAGQLPQYDPQMPLTEP